jgi:hypothetical protein
VSQLFDKRSLGINERYQAGLKQCERDWHLRVAEGAIEPLSEGHEISLRSRWVDRWKVCQVGASDLLRKL